MDAAEPKSATARKTTARKSGSRKKSTTAQDAGAPDSATPDSATQDAVAADAAAPEPAAKDLTATAAGHRDDESAAPARTTGGKKRSDTKRSAGTRKGATATKTDVTKTDVTKTDAATTSAIGGDTAPGDDTAPETGDRPKLDVLAELESLKSPSQGRSRSAARGRKKTSEAGDADDVTAALTAALDDVSEHRGKTENSSSPSGPDSEGSAPARTQRKRKAAPKTSGPAKRSDSASETGGDEVAEAASAEPSGDADNSAPAEGRPTGGRGSRSGRKSRAASGRGASVAPMFSAADADDADDEEADAPGEIRLAATTLLFQAPEVAPHARKRKPKTSQATEPAEEPEGDAEAETEEAAEALDGDADLISSDLAALAAKRRETAAGDDSDGADEESDEDEDSDSADDGAQGDDNPQRRRRRRRGGRGRRKGPAESSPNQDEDDKNASAEAATTPSESENDSEDSDDESDGASRRRRRRRRGSRNGDGDSEDGRGSTRSANDQVAALKGSTRLEAKRQRRREGRDAGRRRQIITEAEFLARRESVDRSMIVREKNGRTQIAVLEDGVLVEHYVSQQSQASIAGNVYLGRVQNVLPSMEAAFVDIGKGRNAVLYAGEVNWDAAGLADGQPRRIEQALKSGDTVVVQVTKDPIGHKGARLTSQVTLAGRYLVFVPGGGMTGISRKLPENERTRLKKILRAIVPDSAGVIVRTAAEGASEEELTADIARLQTQWESIEKKSKSASAPSLLQGEPDMAIRVVRDIFNDDFKELVVSGRTVHKELSSYIHELAPDLEAKLTKWNSPKDVFAEHRIDEQLAKGMDRKVWLPSGGSLVIDRTEAMTVIDVNTGKFTGTGGTLEETVTRNNLEAAEEIVRQLRLRDIGGIVVVDFIDMVLESNRDLVLRRLVECLGRDRTRHQVAEVTSLGLVQMTRKRVGQGLVEAFSETCSHCLGRGFIVHTEPNERGGSNNSHSDDDEPNSKKSRRRKAQAKEPAAANAHVPVLPEATSKEREAVKATLAQIAAAAAHAHDHPDESPVESAEAASVETESAEPAETEPVETGSVEPIETAPVEPVEVSPTDAADAADDAAN